MIDNLPRKDGEKGGTLVVLGTPAEESGGGKIQLLERGGFKGIGIMVEYYRNDVYISCRYCIDGSSIYMRLYVSFSCIIWIDLFDNLDMLSILQFLGCTLYILAKQRMHLQILVQALTPWYVCINIYCAYIYRMLLLIVMLLYPRYDNN